MDDVDINYGNLLKLIEYFKDQIRELEIDIKHLNKIINNKLIIQQNKK